MTHEEVRSNNYQEAQDSIYKVMYHNYAYFKNFNKPHPRPHPHRVSYEGVFYVSAPPSALLLPVLSLSLPLRRRRHPKVDTAAVFLQREQTLFLPSDMPAPDHINIRYPKKVRVRKRNNNQANPTP